MLLWAEIVTRYGQGVISVHDLKHPSPLAFKVVQAGGDRPPAALNSYGGCNYLDRACAEAPLLPSRSPRRKPALQITV